MTVVGVRVTVAGVRATVAGALASAWGRARRPRRRHAVGTAAHALLIAGCATSGAVAGGARDVGGSAALPGARITVVRAHDVVLGLAASRRAVHVLSTGGLLTWDRVFARWEPPMPDVVEALAAAGIGAHGSGAAGVGAFGAVAPPGASSPAARRPWPMAVDPEDDAVWIGVPRGVVVYRSRVGQVTHVPLVGDPEVIGFSRDDGDAWVRAGGSWSRVSRAGFLQPSTGSPPRARLLLPADLDDVYGAFPALRAQLPFLLRDATGDAFAPRLTVGTRSPDRPSEVWAGTWGRGAFVVDATLLRARPLAWGLGGDAVEAIVATPDGVWASTRDAADAWGDPGASGGAAVRAPLTFVRNDLSRFVARGRPAAAIAPLRASGALLVRGAEAWLASGGQLRRLPLDRDDGEVAWRVDDVLPGATATSLVATLDGVWVGTTRGLVHVEAPLGAVPAARGDALTVSRDGLVDVRALVRRDTTLFVGSDRGLFARPVRSDARTDATTARLHARPVLALAAHDSLLVIADAAGVWSRAGDGAVVPLDLGGAVGAGETVVAVAVDDHAIWLATRDAVISIQRVGGEGADPARPAPLARRIETRAWRVGPITSLALGPEYAWVGTRDGLVRVQRTRTGGIE